MSRKRSLLPDVYKPKKRCLMHAAENGRQNGHNSTVTVQNETLTCLLFLRRLFPEEKFEYKLPPIIFRHQLYSIIHNKTTVDKQVSDLREMGEIRMFNIGSLPGEQTVALVFANDYENHVRRKASSTNISQQCIDKFFSFIKVNNVISMDSSMLEAFGFEEVEISELMKTSVLNLRDVGSYWLSIPDAGVFIKSFMRGRKATLTMIRKCKYKEILQEDLLQRKWPKLARLGVRYHIHDVIGADLVRCVDTTSGILLRLQD